jgi:hypothetical protein
VSTRWPGGWILARKFSDGWSKIKFLGLDPEKFLFGAGGQKNRKKPEKSPFWHKYVFFSLAAYDCKKRGKKIETPPFFGSRKNRRPLQKIEIFDPLTKNRKKLKTPAEFGQKFGRSVHGLAGHFECSLPYKVVLYYGFFPFWREVLEVF